MALEFKHKREKDVKREWLFEMGFGLLHGTTWIISVAIVIWLVTIDNIDHKQVYFVSRGSYSETVISVFMFLL